MIISTAQGALGLASGMLVGFSLGLVGGGGSILAVPLMVYVVGVAEPHVAIGTSAIAVAANAAINLSNHARGGTVIWSCALIFAAAGMAGAFGGSILGKMVDGQKLLALFALVMIVIALLMLKTRSRIGLPDVKVSMSNMPALVGLGLATGTMSGFFGIGGGFLIVPALMLATGMPIMNAVSSSLVAVTAFGLTTAASYAWSGLVSWALAGLFVAGGIAGGLAGTRSARHLAERRGALNIVFVVAVLPPLLQSLEALGFIARYLNPPDFDRVMAAAGEPDAALRAVRPRLEQWPADFAHIKTPLETASDAALAAFEALRVVQNGHGDFVSLFRALRYAPRAQEALYALSARLPPVNQFFVDPALHGDTDLAARLAAPANENTGIFHNHNEPGSRGGFSLYVPEYYTPDRAWPLVMALHGGSGNGRGFLWSWLRDARSRGAILIAPTATGNTWALMGDDTDTPNLVRILESVRLRWNIDAERMLLTGMSDGGTFCYVTGFDGASPFTHLAPVSATFHPLMAEMADADRLRDLPVHIVHGRLDWMFPVQVARQTSQALSAAGAKVTYRELDDLSHTYPREMNAEILQWLNGP